jgi:hypothetical protein
MKKLYLILIILIAKLAISQSQWDINTVAVNGRLINDIKYLDANTGYAVSRSADYTCYLHKTTNKGLNWTDQLLIYSTEECPPCLDFINANTGFVAANHFVYLTTNGGSNYFHITSGLSNRTNMRITGIKFYDNTHAFAISDDIYNNQRFYEVGTLTASTSVGYANTWNYGNYPSSADIFLFDIDVYNNGTNIYSVVCGRYIDGSNKHSICIHTSGGFQSGLTILPDNPNVAFDHVSFYPNSYFFRLLGTNGVYEYSNPNQLPELIVQLGINNFDNPNHGLRFTSGATGYAAINDGKIYKTTNGGYNWSYDNAEFGTNNGSNICRNRLTSYNDIIYYGNNISEMYTRRLGINVYTNFDNISLSGSIYLDGQSYNTNPQSPQINLRGGTINLYAYDILTNNQLNREAVFYKWDDNVMSRSNTIYEDFEGGIIKNHYKTKLIADNASAISNPGATKSIRDKNGNINTIYESIGGIFYIKSTGNGTNFLREEIVNDNVYNLNGYSASGNTGPFISEIQKSDNIVANVSPIRNIVACWERRNGNSVEVLASQRDKYINGNYYWKKDDNNSITITSQDQSFKTHPKLFSVITNVQVNGIDTTFHQFKILTYLEPSTNGKKIKARGDYNNGSVSDLRSFDIEEGDMDDFSCVVQAGQFQQFDYDIGFILHYSYKKNGHIYYKKEGIFFSTNSNLIARLTPLNAENISLEDGQGSRYTPDISLRNGLPVIAWQGSNLKTRTIVYEQGNDETMITNQYPIIARYKYSTNGGTNWSTYIKYDSPPNVTQQNPNVEGSKNKNAFLINYSVNNSIFRQNIKHQNYRDYYCYPNSFTGVDAKLVRGSYVDDFGQNSHPMLLTLEQESASLYKVDKQSFIITNSANPVVDNYTNLEGIMRDSNIYYYFNLGPIIVKNTFVSPEMGFDGPIYYTVQNPFEFNENMISKSFYLANGDTLILGGTGKYNPNPNEHFFIKKYNVGLFKQSDNQIQQLLFSDTINTCDTLESEYLRGFIINNISGGSDSFYVQLLIDSSDVSWGSNYSYSCVYSPDEIQGDNLSNFKSKVHFQNQKENNISNIPKTFSLSQNYPNPFNPFTTIKYELPKDAFVTIKVYDIVGREIFTLVNENKQAGYYSVSFNGINFASGVYFYRIKAGDFNAVKRMVLIK